MDLLVRSIPKIVHCQIKSHPFLWVLQQLHAILRYQRYIIERCEGVDKGRLGLRSRIIVYQPTGNIRVKGRRNYIEKTLQDVLASVLILSMDTHFTSSMLPTIAKFFEVSFFAVNRKPYRCAAVRYIMSASAGSV